MKKRLNIDLLQKGDIILTTTDHISSVAIRKATKSDISHAMLCVEHSSVIHAVTSGVRSENAQRIFFDDNLDVHVMRLRGGITPKDAETISNYVRSKVGSEYTYLEAARAWKKVGKKFGARQFCSRLVAQGYAKAGHNLVCDPNFCTPEELNRSSLLIEVPNMTVGASSDEVKFWESYSSGPDLMHAIQDRILSEARRLDKQIQDFNDLGRFVIAHPHHDLAVADLYINSGYLDFWRYDIELHPWHYDLAKMKEIPLEHSVRKYCESTMSGEARDHNRYTQTLEVYNDANTKWPRRTFELLIWLYEILAANHAIRHDVAAEWLEQHDI